MGVRVKKLRDALTEVNDNMKAKLIPYDEAIKYHNGVCIESIADSLAVIADYIEDRRGRRGEIKWEE